MTMLRQLTTSLQQDAGVDCLDLMIHMLQCETMTSSLTSRIGYISQFTQCVSTACTNFEQQLQVRPGLCKSSPL